MNPASGVVSGGTVVTITGTNFVDGATVTFGGVSGTGVTFQNAGTLTATTPSHAAGQVDVTVTNPDGGIGALTDGFRYNALPTVTVVNPASGVVSGGTVVTITGTNFVDGATVTFGGIAGAGVTFQDATTLTATTPAHAAGQVDVTVTNPDGGIGALTDGFRYNALPTVTTVNPASGVVSGGTVVTITGTNFVDGATVTFGGVSGTGVTFQNAGTLTATTPSHAAGQVDVTVTNPDGGIGALTDGFRYNALPTVTVVNPASGVVSGGTVVTITGTNFVDGATVTFGGVSGTGVSFQNASTLTATTPSHAAGQVDVTVTNPDGSSAVLNDGFVYNQTNNRLYVSIGGNCHDKTPCYNSIRDAMNDAETGDIILIAEGTYDELITLDKSISVTLQGGWDSSFKPTTRKTILNNAPKVSGGGALTLQELTVSPPE